MNMFSNTAAVRARTKSSIQPFSYPELSGAAGSTPELATANSQEAHLQREQAAHASGLREGELQALVRYEQTIQECRSGLAETLAQFASERKKYFLSVEKEVVQLAINIARKILLREVQIDPLLLGGMVRVVLEQTGQRTHVTLSGHPDQVSSLSTFFARQCPDCIPDIVEDASLGINRCTLQTSLGTTEIGPEVQLREIEKGLLDLQAVTPR